jgi:hypothetical protein
LFECCQIRSGDGTVRARRRTLAADGGEKRSDFDANALRASSPPPVRNVATHDSMLK